MKNSLKSFLAWYESIHELKVGYSTTNEKDSHRAATRELFIASMPFLRRLPLSKISNVLDVGLGYGFHCEYFASKGLETTGISSHVTEELEIAARTAGYTVQKMDMHFLCLPDGNFDLVWSHHSLEHSFSPLLALREWYRVLKPEGYLAVSVPPHKHDIVSGHFNVGWSIGQLMYLLGICGYDLKSSYFIEDGYNVRALVKRPLTPIDSSGLSWMINLEKHFPESLRSQMKNSQRSLGKLYFNGALKKVTEDTCIEKCEMFDAASKRRCLQMIKCILKKTLGV